MLNHIKTYLKGLIIGTLALFAWQYASAASLEGSWAHNNQRTSIRIAPNFKFIFCNEVGDCAEGFYRRGVIFVPRWNVKGFVSNNENFISWTNGTEWRRNFGRNNNFNQQGDNFSISGPWYHDGKLATIQLRGDGQRFIVKTEFGQYMQGYLKGNVLIIPQYNLTGSLSKHGKKIRWSNGTIWYRNR